MHTRYDVIQEACVMDKFKRNERLAIMTKVLSGAPNRIFTLSHFCDMFGAAKSTVSEDVAILAETLRTFKMGTLETVTGAAGGVRYRPMVECGVGRDFVEGICEQLREGNRVLPGGFLYCSDILSDPQLVSGMGHIFAAQYYDADIDFVLTMETKGIPVALMTAEALHVPLIIARRSSKVYEGSAVNINYVSGKGGIGVGLCVRIGGAAGGDDALAMVISQKLKTDISNAYLFTDMLVLTLSLTYIPARRIACSLITVTISSKLIGWVQKVGLPVEN